MESGFGSCSSVLSALHTLASLCGGQIESDSLTLLWLMLMPEIWLPGTQVLTYLWHFRHLTFLIPQHF